MHALPSDIHLLDVDRPPEPGRLIWPRKGPLDVAQGMSEARLRSSLKPCVSNGPPGELAAVRPPGAILETRPTAWPPDPPPARPPRTPPRPFSAPSAYGPNCSTGSRFWRLGLEAQLGRHLPAWPVHAAHQTPTLCRAVRICARMPCEGLLQPAPYRHPPRASAAGRLGIREPARARAQARVLARDRARGIP